MKSKSKVEIAIEELATDGTNASYELQELHINDETLEELAEALRKNLTLLKLNLSCNQFAVRGITALAEAVGKNMRLLELDLSYNVIGPDGLCALSQCLVVNDTLTCLKLNHASLTGAAGSERAIDLSGIFAFAEAIKANRSIDTLELRGNCLTDYGEVENGLEKLMEAIADSVYLVVVDLSENGLGKSGAEVVCKWMIQKKSELQTLFLRGNRIQAGGAKHFAHLLCQPECHLQKLDLADNDISESNTNVDGIKALMESLQTRLKMDDSDWTRSLGVKVDKQGNQTLWYLDLRQNGFEETFIKEEMERTLRLNGKLSDVRFLGDVDDDPITIAFCDDSNRAKIRINETVTRMNAKTVPHQPFTLETNKTDQHGCSLLHEAVIHRSILATYLLLQRLQPEMVNLPSEYEKKTALHYAVLHPEPLIVRMLFGAGADPNKVDRNSNSPLHLAVQHSDMAMAMLLIQSKASLTLKNRRGDLPIDCTELQYFRREMMKIASQYDLLIVSSHLNNERRLAQHLARKLSLDYQLNVTFLDPADRLVDLEFPNLYAAAILAIVGSDEAQTQFKQSYINLVEKCRENVMWNPLAKASIQPTSVFCLVTYAYSSLLQNHVFNGARCFDMTHYGNVIMEHTQRIADLEYRERIKSKREETKEDNIIRMLAKKKFKMTELDRLKEEWPSMGKHENETLINLVEKVKASVQAMENRRKSDLVEFVGSKWHEYQLKLMIRSKEPFGVIVDLMGGKNFQIGVRIRDSLDKEGYACWIWPHPLPQNRKREHALLQEAMNHSCCCILLHQNGKPPSKEVEESLQRVVKNKPMAKINIIDNEWKQQVQEQHETGPIFTVVRDDPKQIEQCTNHLGYYLYRQTGNYCRNSTADQQEQNVLFMLMESQRKVKQLELELKRKNRIVSACKELNAGLFQTVEVYEQKWRQAVQILNPPKPKCRPEQEVYILRQESLRLRAAPLLRADDIVSTDLYEKLGEPNPKLPVTKKDLEEFIDTRLLVSKIDFAVVEVQRIWRGCWTRELLRRKKENDAARKIQRVYRLYRFRKLAYL